MERPTYRAYLCGGPNCGPKGSQQLLSYLEAQVDHAGLSDQVEVAATGCQAHCESGVTMVVYPGRVFYQGIDRDRLARIVAEHFAAGQPVRDFFWNGVRKRILPETTPSVPGLRVEKTSDEVRKVKEEKRKRSYEDVGDFKW